MTAQPRHFALRRESEQLAARFPALTAEAQRIAASITHGVHGRRRAGPGETFWQYRPHRSEDGLRAVDWRRSGRGDQLFVREREWEAANTVLLWRDGSAGMHAQSAGLPRKQDRAAVCLMALASVLARGGERLTVLGETGRARSGATGLEQVTRALADGPGEVASVERADAPRQARIVLASDFLDPPETWEARLSSLTNQSASGVLLRVIDPAEEDFPFTGRTRFTAPAEGDPVLLGRPQDARSRYHAIWSEHGAALSDLARRAGWPLITHRTDRPAASAVLALYQALEGQSV